MYDAEIPTSKERLAQHVHLHDPGTPALSKRELAVHHRLTYPGCSWNANRPRVVNAVSTQASMRRLRRGLVGLALEAARSAGREVGTHDRDR